MCYLFPLQVLFLCVAGLALAAPRPQDEVPKQPRIAGDNVAILRDDRSDNGDGNFAYDFEADNGISVNVVGTPGSAGQSNMQGVFK